MSKLPFLVFFPSYFPSPFHFLSRFLFPLLIHSGARHQTPPPLPRRRTPQPPPPGGAGSGRRVGGASRWAGHGPERSSASLDLPTACPSSSLTASSPSIPPPSAASSREAQGSRSPPSPSSLHPVELPRAGRGGCGLQHRRPCVSPTAGLELGRLDPAEARAGECFGGIGLPCSLDPIPCAAGGRAGGWSREQRPKHDGAAAARAAGLERWQRLALEEAGQQQLEEGQYGTEGGGAVWSHDTWLHLPCGSRNRLQRGLLVWSCRQNARLAGLRPEPLAESLVEPCQTGR